MTDADKVDYKPNENNLEEELLQGSAICTYQSIKAETCICFSVARSLWFSLKLSLNLKLL